MSTWLKHVRLLGCSGHRGRSSCCHCSQQADGDSPVVKKYSKLTYKTYIWYVSWMMLNLYIMIICNIWYVLQLCCFDCIQSQKVLSQAGILQATHDHTYLVTSTESTTNLFRSTSTNVHIACAHKDRGFRGHGLWPEEVLEIPQSTATGPVARRDRVPYVHNSLFWRDRKHLRISWAGLTGRIWEFASALLWIAWRMSRLQVATLIGKNATTINALKTYSKLCAQLAVQSLLILLSCRSLTRFAVVWSMWDCQGPCLRWAAYTNGGQSKGPRA